MSCGRFENSVVKEDLQAGDYLQVDETPLRVLDLEVKGKCATGYLWVGGQPQDDVIFEFHIGGGKEYALKLLGHELKGYLQRDGYGVYGSIARERPEFFPAGCWSHERRKHVDAEDHEPDLARWFVLESSTLLGVYVGCVSLLFSDVTTYYLTKLHKASGKVAFLIYDDFHGKTFGNFSGGSKLIFERGSWTCSTIQEIIRPWRRKIGFAGRINHPNVLKLTDLNHAAGPKREPRRERFPV